MKSRFQQLEFGLSRSNTENIVSKTIYKLEKYVLNSLLTSTEKKLIQKNIIELKEYSLAIIKLLNDDGNEKVRNEVDLIRNMKAFTNSWLKLKQKSIKFNEKDKRLFIQDLLPSEWTRVGQRIKKMLKCKVMVSKEKLNSIKNSISICYYDIDDKITSLIDNHVDPVDVTAVNSLKIDVNKFFIHCSAELSGVFALDRYNDIDYSLVLFPHLNRVTKILDYYASPENSPIPREIMKVEKIITPLIEECEILTGIFVKKDDSMFPSATHDYYSSAAKTMNSLRRSESCRSDSRKDDIIALVERVKKETESLRERNVQLENTIFELKDKKSGGSYARKHLNGRHVHLEDGKGTKEFENVRTKRDVVRTFSKKYVDFDKALKVASDTLRHSAKRGPSLDQYLALKNKQSLGRSSHAKGMKVTFKREKDARSSSSTESYSTSSYESDIRSIIHNISDIESKKGELDKNVAKLQAKLRELREAGNNSTKIERRRVPPTE